MREEETGGNTAGNYRHNETHQVNTTADAENNSYHNKTRRLKGEQGLTCHRGEHKE